MILSLRPWASLSTLFLALTFTSHLAAAPIAIADHSFESNSSITSAGDWSNNIGPDWTGLNGQNGGGAFEEFITGFSADGNNHLGMTLNYDVWQDLDETYQANTLYTLTVAVGHRNSFTNASNASAYALADTDGNLLSSGSLNASTIPNGSFADAPDVTLDTAANPGAVGRTIRVLLQARGNNRSHFDNVRLDAELLFNPGAALVVNEPASNVSENSAVLHGRVTDTGSAAPSATIYHGTVDAGTDAGA